MKKIICLLSTFALLTACGGNGDQAEPKVKEEAEHHEHQGNHYDNKQLSLHSNTGEHSLTFPELLDPVSKKGDKVTYELTAQQGTMSFVDGVKTKTYGYNGDILGPTLRLKKGQEVTIKLKNALPEPTTFHWHGLEVAGDATDGGPHETIKPGETKTITFTVNQQAATLWYHPHPMGNTASQVYKGLAGLLYIDDEKSESLHIPKEYGVDDFPIVLQDRTFVDGKIRYEEVANTMSTLGDTIMINGVVNPKLTVTKEKTIYDLITICHLSLLRRMADF